MNLIVTADDFALTRGINYGIYDACVEGIVNSVSLIMNTKHTDHGILLMNDRSVAIGVSLNMTFGIPVILKESSLTDYGFFKPTHAYDEIDLKDVKTEFRAQIDLAIKKGVDISFLTTYEHIHAKQPAIYNIVESLAKEYTLNFRFQKDNLIEVSESFHNKKASFDALTLILLQLSSNENVELVVHPGFLCGHLINIHPYRELRLVEHSILTSPYIKTYLKEQNIVLKTYAEING